MIRGLNYWLKLKCHAMVGEGITSKDVVIPLRDSHILKIHDSSENGGLRAVSCFWKLSGTYAWHGEVGIATLHWPL